MSCRFRGSFSETEKERIEKAARSVEKALSQDTENRSSWAFLHFKAPYDGYIYWGVRFEDGHMLGGDTADELAESLGRIEKERKRLRDRAMNRARRSIGSPNVEADA